MRLTTGNNTFIMAGDIIGIQYPNYNYSISLVEGRIMFENVIVNINTIVIPRKRYKSKEILIRFEI